MNAPASQVDRLNTALAGRYRIERELGAGGMATVYLAEDLKHDRKVAIKVLKPELAAVLGAERFVVEIKTTAAMSHPHILPLFDSGTVDGFLFYVMPYIQGETIREKLNRETQFGVDEAIRIAREVADALDYAHRHGVIHRDIKPENILLHDGRAMVMDFGIALAVSAAAGGRMTETGLSLGTPHYMSPEQATAEKEITPKSDVYSLAIVLYEMLAGQPPHVGGAAQQIIMKIITEAAQPVTNLRKAVPANVSAALATALEKLPADRFESAKAFGDALANPRFATAATTAAGSVRGGAGSRRKTFAAMAVAAVATVIAAWGWLRPPPERPVSATFMKFAAGEEPPPGPIGFALSEDGSMFAYLGPIEAGRQRIWLKRRSELHATPLAGTEGATYPFFSPDGEWIGFASGGKLRKVSTSGSSVTPIADAAMSYFWADWLNDGRIVFSGPEFSFQVVSQEGGPVTSLLKAPETNRGAVGPTRLPGSRGILFASCGPGCMLTDVWVHDLRSGESRRIVTKASGALYLSSGHLLYNDAAGSLVAAPFDLETLSLTGPATPVISGVARIAGFYATRDGTLVYQDRGAVQRNGPIWLDRSGRATAIDSTWSGMVDALALSPDGKRLAVSMETDRTQHIWVRDLDRGVTSRLTFGERGYTRPMWTPDGQSLVYIPNGGGAALMQRADGTGPVTKLADSIRTGWGEVLVSRDKAWLVLRSMAAGGSRDILARRLTGDTTLKELVATPASEYSPAVSPDGKWLAYGSEETGTGEVFVRPFPDAASAKFQISTNGGSEPVWANSGRELFYIDAAFNLVSVEVSTSPTFAAGRQRVLFPVPLTARDNAHALYAVSPDDQRFVMVPFTGVGGGDLAMIDNFFELVKAKLASRAKAR